MYPEILLFTILIVTFAMVAAKRITALISAFRLQSFLLFLVTFYSGMRLQNVELCIIAAMLFLLKVILIPVFLRRIMKRINIEERVGLLVNPLLSLLIALLLTYLAYKFSGIILAGSGNALSSNFVVSLAVTMFGVFIMTCRTKAISQIIGLLVMENGLFILAATVSEGMPFFVEVAIFFDVFICVVILGIFVYRINRLFTHIDVNKLRELKG